MCIRAGNEPIQAKGGGECVHVGLPVRRISAQEFDNVDRAWPSFVLVLPGRHDPERLTGVLLMHTQDVVASVLTVIALDDDGDFLSEPHDFRLRGGEAKTACKPEADVLVLGVAIEMAGWRFPDVRRRDAPGGDAPTIILQEQGGLWLGSGAAELN